MKITGELLKSERTRKNLTIQDVAFALKLSPKMISAIEAGQTEILPTKTFIRGFVKSYAQFLKIDAEQVMRQFQEEMGSTHPLNKNAVVASPSRGGSSVDAPDHLGGELGQKRVPSEQTKVLTESTSNRSFIYVGIAVVLVILIVATNRVVDRYQKETVVNQQDISKVQPLDPNQTQVPVSTNATGTTPPSSVPVPTSAGVAVKATPNDSTTATPSAAAAPALTAPAAAAPIPATPTTQTAQSIASTATTSTPATELSANLDDGFEASSGKPVELILEARKETVIMYARGNTKTFSKLKLNSKQIQIIRSSTGLHLKADDGGAFTMVVNGVEKGPAGTNNKPVKLSF